MLKNLTFFLFIFISIQLFANDTTYVNRQSEYINTSLQNTHGHLFSLKAYQGIPIDSMDLDTMLHDLTERYNPDFDIVELIRVLFYSNNLYDNQILSVLDEIPFWINKDDSIRNFWTENHMIMWMSSEWLLHERYNRPIDNTLRPRLIHYLETKIDYGFYEFFSSVYAPYTLSGLLNLSEFSEDTEIKALSEKVAQLLLKDLLKPTTDKGVYFPAAGRNYPGKYEQTYGQNHNSLIYLLTGMGEVPNKASHAGAFLATSSLEVDEVINSWTANLNTTLRVGHDLKESFFIHKDLNDRDQLIFQWSASAYAHPSLINNSFQLLADSNLWSHKDWDALRPLSIVSSQNAASLAEELSILSYGSIISGYDLSLFKNQSVALMSIKNLWKGKIGYQQWPFVATVGTTPVYTLSGKTNTDWNDRDKTIENTHMPHVEQNANLALVMYRPEPLPELLSTFAGDMFNSREVSLYWQENAYDEVVENGAWLIGRQDENYVAVRRSCTEMQNTWWSCETGAGQTWAILVGDMSMYQSFDNFQTLVSEAEFSEDWYFDPESAQSVYYASIKVDDLFSEYTWGVDSAVVFSKTSNTFSLYPNPSSTLIHMNFNKFLTESTSIKVYNSLGEKVYEEQIDVFPSSSTSFKTSNWPTGTYTVVLQNEKDYQHKKLVKI